MKVKIKDNIVNVPDYFQVIDNMLYNNNTKKYEGVDGDIVIVTRGGTKTKGHVKCYTEYQIVPTYEWPTQIVSAQGLYDGTSRIEFIHQTPVYKI